MNVDSQPLVSVITPVYNGEKYLTKCIESVITQTYKNWEYIIVNNCSTDRTLEIAKNHAEKDNRIRIHNNKEFVGVIQNHNNAFRLISPESKYCKILHADDRMFPECLSQMVRVADANPSVSIVGSYSLWGTEVACDGLPYESTVLSGKEISRLSLLRHVYPFLSPSSLLIRSSYIRGKKKFWNNDSLHADVIAWYGTLKDSDFGFVHQVLTYIRKHDESMTSAYAQRMNTIILSNLDLLIKFGPDFLTREEYENILRNALWKYYQFLGRSVVERRDKQFWMYHKKSLQLMGQPLNYTRLSIAVLRTLMNRFF